MAIHGKATLELTNVKTGEVEVVEEENMVTNALSMIFDFLINYVGESPCSDIYRGSIWRESQCLTKRFLTETDTTFSPILHSMLGGVMLFDQNLEENADNILPPNIATAEMVGCATEDTNTTDYSYRGSLNVTESVPVANGYKWVWDFTTSQANGQIGCICLTSKNAGYNGVQPDRHGADTRFFKRRRYTTNPLNTSARYLTEDMFDTYSAPVSVNYQRGDYTVQNIYSPNVIGADLKSRDFTIAFFDITDNELYFCVGKVESEFYRFSLQSAQGEQAWIRTTMRVKVADWASGQPFYMNGYPLIKVIADATYYHLTTFFIGSTQYGTYDDDGKPLTFGADHLSYARVNKTTGAVDKVLRYNDIPVRANYNSAFAVKDGYLFALCHMVDSTAYSGYYYMTQYIARINLDNVNDLTRYYFYADEEARQNGRIFRSHYSYSSNRPSSLESAGSIVGFCELGNGLYGSLNIKGCTVLNSNGISYGNSDHTGTPVSYSASCLAYLDGLNVITKLSAYALALYEGLNPSYSYPSSTSSGEYIIDNFVKFNDAVILHTHFYGGRCYASAKIIDPLLMTINNLSQPVTKTADKTMKLTYTITEDTES